MLLLFFFEEEGVSLLNDVGYSFVVVPEYFASHHVGGLGVVGAQRVRPFIGPGPVTVALPRLLFFIILVSRDGADADEAVSFVESGGALRGRDDDEVVVAFGGDFREAKVHQEVARAAHGR